MDVFEAVFRRILDQEEIYTQIAGFKAARWLKSLAMLTIYVILTAVWIEH